MSASILSLILDFDIYKCSLPLVELERIDQDDLTSSPWQFLGKGQYGEVFKAKMKGASVAVKILEKIQNPSKLNEGRILR